MTGPTLLLGYCQPCGVGAVVDPERQPSPDLSCDSCGCPRAMLLLRHLGAPGPADKPASRAGKTTAGRRTHKGRGKPAPGGPC